MSESEKVPAVSRGSNGSVFYKDPGHENEHERVSRERFWKSLGKKIRNRSRVSASTAIRRKS